MRNKGGTGDGVHTDQRSHNHCDCTDGHCSSHVVASCVFVLLVPSIISTSPSSSTRASLVSSVKTHLATLPSQGEQLRTGKSDVYQQPIAGLTLLALRRIIRAAPRVNVDFSSRCGAPFPSVSPPITRPADHRRQGHPHQYLPQCLLPHALLLGSRKIPTPQFFAQKQHDEEHEHTSISTPQSEQRK